MICLVELTLHCYSASYTKFRFGVLQYADVYVGCLSGPCCDDDVRTQNQR
jgi:hypothetical protein